MGSGQCEIGRQERGHVMGGLIRQAKEFGYFSVEPLKVFKRECGQIWFHSGR